MEIDSDTNSLDNMISFMVFHFFFLAELVMHRERVERHCKGVTTSLNEFKARFQEMIEEHDKEVK